MSERIIMERKDDPTVGEYYVSSNDGSFEPFYTMIREPYGSKLKSKHGNPLAGKWILREGIEFIRIIDFDQYSNDLAERHNLQLP